jgi:hypothetical protein
MQRQAAMSAANKGPAAMTSFEGTISASANDARTLRDIRGASRPVLHADRVALVIIDAQEEYVRGPLRLDGVEAAIDEIVGCGRGRERTASLSSMSARRAAPTRRSSPRGAGVLALWLN